MVTFGLSALIQPPILWTFSLQDSTIKWKRTTKMIEKSCCEITILFPLYPTAIDVTPLLATKMALMPQVSITVRDPESEESEESWARSGGNAIEGIISKLSCWLHPTVLLLQYFTSHALEFISQSESTNEYFCGAQCPGIGHRLYNSSIHFLKHTKHHSLLTLFIAFYSDIFSLSSSTLQTLVSIN